ncbi:MAG: iron-sulfur cluster assembly scaffold protein [Bacteroidales bacterium]|nr:iron-sulfur cluster assembly scaffold protein [Lentimicrobiaceae bacterium]MDD5695543.1 iron-sulfur cluster assembly scaffold protein [Bacteroidales bacterium]
MSEVYDLLKTSGYSDRAIEYYETHLHVGSMANPDAHAIFTGSCGDTMEFFLKISDVISDAKFQAIGCAGAFASGSALCEIIKGKLPMDCHMLDETDILNHLGSMPPQKTHCARLAIVTLHRAIEQYITKKQ